MTRVKAHAYRCIHCGHVFRVKRAKNRQIVCPKCRDYRTHVGSKIRVTTTRNRGVVPLVPTE